MKTYESGFEHQGGKVGEKRPGPNEKCHCGSGKKFKKCCLYAGIDSTRYGRRYATGLPEETIGENSAGRVRTNTGAMAALIPLLVMSGSAGFERRP